MNIDRGSLLKWRVLSSILGVILVSPVFAQQISGTQADVAASGAASNKAMPPVIAPPESFFDKFPERDRDVARAFYKKYIDLKGIPVAAAEVVADEALQRTYNLVAHLLAGRLDIIEAMSKGGMRLIIIGKDQVYTDMPEYRNSPNPRYQNERVRGTGGYPTSFGEENLLNLPIDRYDDESIGLHEFSHAVDSTLGRMDRTWSGRLNQVYRNAMSRGLWKNSYLTTNAAEYWAEGVTMWRSQISIATGRRIFLVENLSGSPKTKACAGAVVE